MREELWCFSAKRSGDPCTGLKHFQRASTVGWARGMGCLCLDIASTVWLKILGSLLAKPLGLEPELTPELGHI